MYAAAAVAAVRVTEVQRNGRCSGARSTWHTCGGAHLQAGKALPIRIQAAVNASTHVTEHHQAHASHAGPTNSNIKLLALVSLSRWRQCYAASRCCGDVVSIAGSAVPHLVAGPCQGPLHDGMAASCWVQTSTLAVLAAAAAELCIAAVLTRDCRPSLPGLHAPR